MAKERPINKRLREMTESIEKAEAHKPVIKGRQPLPPPNPRMVLLDAMKAELSTDPEARQAFRENDVQVILERWDGATPMLWFSWETGTHLMLLGTEREPEIKVHMAKREFGVAADMARGGRVFMIDPNLSDSLSYTMTALDFHLAHDTLAEYYEVKSTPSSVHAPMMYS